MDVTRPCLSPCTRKRCKGAYSGCRPLGAGFRAGGDLGLWWCGQVLAYIARHAPPGEQLARQCRLQVGPSYWPFRVGPSVPASRRLVRSRPLKVSSSASLASSVATAHLDLRTDNRKYKQQPLPTRTGSGHRLPRLMVLQAAFPRVATPATRSADGRGLAGRGGGSEDPLYRPIALILAHAGLILTWCNR